MMAGRFVAIGDSFTEGVGDPNLLYPNGVRGWACRMARQLGRADPEWEYANLAIRSKVLDEIVDEQLDDALALKPTLLTFYAGGNDILSLRPDMQSVLDRYDAALARLTASPAQVVTFTTYDATTSSVLEPIRRRITFYNNSVREIAAARGALLIDHNSYDEFADRRLWSPDRIHMSRAGHKTLASYVLRELGIPHTLKVPEFPEWEPAGWRQNIIDESQWVRDEVIPLFRRRMRGIREGDLLTPKWPEPIHPADGMKRLARERSGDAMLIHAKTRGKHGHTPRHEDSKDRAGGRHHPKKTGTKTA